MDISPERATEDEACRYVAPSGLPLLCPPTQGFAPGLPYGAPLGLQSEDVIALSYVLQLQLFRLDEKIPTDTAKNQGRKDSQRTTSFLNTDYTGRYGFSRIYCPFPIHWNTPAFLADQILALRLTFSSAGEDARVHGEKKNAITTDISYPDSRLTVEVL